jgi:glutamate/tyrosine decarboxylase-like PLP-dependent enzyme
MKLGLEGYQKRAKDIIYAADKLRNYLLNNSRNFKVVGKNASLMCVAFVSVNPELKINDFHEYMSSKGWKFGLL